MAFIFGGAPARAPAERGRPPDPFREHQRELRRGVRTLEREDLKAAQTEKTYKTEITRLARDQRLDLCKAKAREMIRLRCHRARLGTIRFHMNSLAQQLTTMQGAQQLQGVMARTTRLLQGLNRAMDPRAVHRMLLEFERQSAAMADGQEILHETLDAVFETDDEATATDDAMAQVFQELGLDVQGSLGPSRAGPDPGAGVTEEELDARLSRLRAP